MDHIIEALRPKREMDMDINGQIFHTALADENRYVTMAED